VVETALARRLSHLNTESSVYLGFDAPTLIFYRFRSDLRGFPSCTAACSIVANRTGASWTSPHLQSLCSNLGSVLTEPPLLGFVHGLPRCRHSLVRPLLELPKQLTRPTDANQQVSFRSRGFSPPQRFTPYASSHILRCAASRGSRCFTDAARKCRANPPYVSVPAPHHANTPRRIPLAYSRSASLRPLPSCRYRASSSRSKLLDSLFQHTLPALIARSHSSHLRGACSHTRSPPGGTCLLRVFENG